MAQEPWVIDGQGFSRRIGGRLLVHCFIMMFLGFAGGFVWLIHLAGNILHIVPLPLLHVAVPDRGDLIQNTHIGPMLNAMYVMAIVLLSPRLNFSALQAKWVYYAAIATLWGNLIGYSAAVYAPQRGLQPIGDWPNLVSYASFYIAVVGVVIFTGISLLNALRAARNKPS